ncbi:MAG: BrnA antitoxin family protein [Fibromonadales bacterium]|nr:BrnA antitoxin family protein [Fibromonadales bacterium]
MSKIVRYKMSEVPEPSKKDWDRVKAIKDEDIDYSDIPEITDFSGFHPYLKRKLYKPIKKTVTCKLDADIIAWLKMGGKGYQTRLNSILRDCMQIHFAKDSKKPKWNSKTLSHKLYFDKNS